MIRDFAYETPDPRCGAKAGKLWGPPEEERGLRPAFFAIAFVIMFIMYFTMIPGASLVAVAWVRGGRDRKGFL
jgi:hypothetical protein